MVRGYINRRIVSYIVILVVHITNLWSAEEDLFLNRVDCCEQEIIKHNNSVPGISFCYSTKNSQEGCKECDIVYRYVQYLAVKKAIRPDLEVSINSLQELHFVVNDVDSPPEFLGQAHHDMVLLAHALQRKNFTTSEYAALIAKANLLWEDCKKNNVL
jgi:hypothetical protein